jgi:stress-induced morphogen
MNNFLRIIEDKVKKKIKVESILIKDNSRLHEKHKFFDSKKYHLSFEIESIYLNSLSKIKAHREIMNLLSEEIRTKIHALEIKIK